MKPITIFTVVCILLGQPCLAYENNKLIEKEISNYQSKNFKKVIEIGNSILQDHPDNVTARYYLAGALVELNRKNEAIKQYNQCALLTRDTRIRSYCLQEIKSLENLGIRSGPVHQKTNAATPDIQESQSQKTNLSQAAINEIGYLRERANKDIARINDDVANQLREVPENINNRAGSIPNPDYQSLSEQLRTDAKVRIDRINQDFEKQKAAITETDKHR